jgi:hypothetical protein
MSIRAFEHLETTSPVVTTCHRCGSTVLRGLAEGLRALADITPISTATETEHLAAGRATYTLRRTGLIHRDPVRRGDPALAAPILAAHRCPTSPPPAGRQMPLFAVTPDLRSHQ